MIPEHRGTEEALAASGVPYTALRNNIYTETLLLAVPQIVASGVHAANSGATILHADSHLDLVRPGISIYGIEPAPGVGADLRPALSWRSSVTMAKRLAAGDRVSYGHRYELGQDAWVATVPVGYADGYARALSGADVLIGGRRCPVAGSVTMDQLMVDCGDVEPMPGEEVVLLGRQGGETVGAWELAAHAHDEGKSLGPAVQPIGGHAETFGGLSDGQEGVRVRGPTIALVGRYQPRGHR